MAGLARRYACAFLPCSAHKSDHAWLGSGVAVSPAFSILICIKLRAQSQLDTHFRTSFGKR